MILDHPNAFQEEAPLRRATLGFLGAICVSAWKKEKGILCKMQNHNIK
jgi:hypothetical protein